MTRLESHVERVEVKAENQYCLKTKNNNIISLLAHYTLCSMDLGNDNVAPTPTFISVIEHNVKSINKRMHAHSLPDGGTIPGAVMGVVAVILLIIIIVVLFVNISDKLHQQKQLERMQLDILGL